MTKFFFLTLLLATSSIIHAINQDKKEIYTPEVLLCLKDAKNLALTTIAGTLFKKQNPNKNSCKKVARFISKILKRNKKSKVKLELDGQDKIIATSTLQLNNYVYPIIITREELIDSFYDHDLIDTFAEIESLLEREQFIRRIEIYSDIKSVENSLAAEQARKNITVY